MASPIMRHFAWEHLPPHLQFFSKKVFNVAHQMETHLPDSAEKSAGLRKLLEAKDCFVRAAIEVPVEERLTLDQVFNDGLNQDPRR